MSNASDFAPLDGRHISHADLRGDPEPDGRPHDIDATPVPWRLRFLAVAAVVIALIGCGFIVAGTSHDACAVTLRTLT